MALETERNQYIDEGEITAKQLIVNAQDWLSYVFSKWLIILIASAIGGVVGLVYASLKRPIYTATTTFVLESDEGRSGISRLSGMAAMAGITIQGDAGGLFQGNNILELYKSRTMLEQTLLAKVYPNSDELLIDRYIAYNKIKDEWKSKPELFTLDFGRNPNSLDSIPRRLREGVITSFANDIRSNVLSIQRVDKNLSILQVDVASPDEVFAKVFNETLVQNVNEFYVETKTKKSSDNIEILEAKVDSVRAVMSGAIYSAAKIADATPNLNPTRQVQRIAPTQESQFSVEANKAMLAQLLQNLELAKMNLLQEQPLIQLVDKPVYPLKVDQLGKAKGIIIGGVLFGLIMIVFLVVKKWYHNIMDIEN